MPENTFYNGGLLASHETLIQSIVNYLTVSARERVPQDSNPGNFVLSIKSAGAERHIENYDEKYQNQVDEIRSAVNQLWTAWGEYARAAKLFEMSNNSKTTL
jgi:hypothetical protein